MNPKINFHGGDETTGHVAAVETFAPAGMLLEAHRHSHAHLSVLAVGVADVTIAGETTRREGPCVVVVPADTEHCVRAVTDVAWYCLWADSLTPLAQVEESLRLCSRETQQEGESCLG